MTLLRIFERIREEGYQGGYTAVKDTVRALKSQLREVYVPLVHRPGEAHVDFGYALVKQDGAAMKELITPRTCCVWLKGSF